MCMSAMTGAGGDKMFGDGEMFGIAAIVGVLLLVGGAVGGLILEVREVAVWHELRKPATLSIIRFTLLQATLSTLLAVGLAIPLARALARRGRFLGRRIIIHFSSVSLIIPTMVAVIGVVAVHGRGGWVNDALAVMGFARRDYLYGLTGILIAHTFFNLPLATRILLGGLLTVPQTAWNLAALYGMQPRHIFRHIELPLLRGLLPGVAGLVFLLCFTSFAIVLTLGGGPQSTTLEVAIYQAIRFDFDLAQATALSLIQIAICGGLAALFFARATTFPLRPGDYPGVRRPDADAWLPRVTDGTVIVVAAAFLFAPLLAVVVRALSPAGYGILADPEFHRALRWTITIAIAAGALSCALALAVAGVIVTMRRSVRWARFAVAPELCGLLTLLVPPITLGAGLFLLLRRFSDALSLAPALVIALNALLALAFGIRILTPALFAARSRYDDLCVALGIRGLHYWRHILWHAMRAPTAYAAAIAATLAAGDMGVIALFGTDDLATLPLLMYRLIGAYRLPQAAVVAVVLCALCFVMFWVIEGLGRVGGGYNDGCGGDGYGVRNA